MKNLFTNFSKTLALSLFLVLGIGNAWGGNLCGFCDKAEMKDENVYIKYSKNGASATQQYLYINGQSDIDLGTVTSLNISEFRAITKKHDGNVCEVRLYYLVDESREAEIGSTNYESATYDNYLYPDWTWADWWKCEQYKNPSVDLNILNGLTPGDYYFNFYFSIYGNNNSSTGCWEHQAYWSNNGGNYHMSFTVPSKSLTVAGAANGNTVSGYQTDIASGTAYTITATAAPGYKFNGWTATSGSSSITIADATSAETTVTFNDYANDATVTASFVRTYAFVQGRFHVTDAARSGSWTNTFEDNDDDKWDVNSTKIPFAYDGTNHEFYCHTYATPYELSAQIASNNPWFSVATSTESNSMSNKTSFNSSEDTNLSDKGSANGVSLGTSNSYSVKFNSSDDANGYAVLCFDESKIWYELECALTYNANEGTGDAPASRTYYAYNSNQTAAANTFTKNGYIFTGWNTEANGSGTAYAPGASVSMNAKEVTLYAQWIAEGDIDCWDGNEYKCGSIPNFNTPKPGSTTWSGATWGGGEAPTSETTVVLKAPMTVSSGTAYAKKVALTGSTATLTIDNGAALVVTDNITKDGEAPTASDLALGGSASGNATLIFNNNNSAAATVGTYSIASTTPTWTWQYVAVPFSVSTSSYSGAEFYAWTSGGWSKVTSGSLSPWTTYCMTQESATGYSPSGTLEATDTQGDVTFSTYQTGDADKYVLCSNSWTAPIQIRQIEASDIGDSDKTIWLFNTGLDPEGTGTVSESASAAGTYLSIPINAAPYVADKISSLQSFIVKTSLTLNYTKHVRPSGDHSVVNPAMRAPKQVTENEPTVVKLNVSGSRYADQLLLLEREDFTSGYDTGWDGEKLDETTTAPQLFTLREDGTPDAVSAIPELETTPIAFRAGEDTQYTMSFTYDGEEDLYLIDTENNNASTLISNENTYTFTTSSKKATPRFTISRAPQIATGMENAQSDDAQCTKARKLMLDGQLYLMYKGTMYNVQGAVIK